MHRASMAIHPPVELNITAMARHAMQPSPHARSVFHATPDITAAARTATHLALIAATGIIALGGPIVLHVYPP